MAKARVTVTVGAALLRQCDRAARGGASRSEVFEQALAGWLRDARRRSLEDDVERYYASRGIAERAEDAEWAGLVPRILGEVWT